MAKKREPTAPKRPHAAIAAQRKSNPLLYVGSVVVLVLITVSFIGAPAIGRFAGIGSSVVFGYYDGVEISHQPGNYFHSQILEIAEQRRGVSGEQQNADTEFYTIIRQAFQRATFRVALLARANRSAVAVSHDRIDSELIRSGPYVIGGVFSEERYNDTPASQKRSNRNLIQDRLLERQYLRDLAELHASANDAAFFQEMGARERRFSVASFSFDQLPEARLIEFGLERTDLFRRIKLSRIRVGAGTGEAQEVLQRLRDGSASFEELARLYSLDDVATGGEVGWKYFYDLERDFEDAAPAEAVFALNAGETTEVLTSRFGEVIYRADAALVAPDFSEAEVQAAVQDYLSRYERGFVQDFYTGRAEQFRTLALADGFAAAAAALGVETVESDFFPINFQNLLLTQPVRAGDDDALRTAPYYEEFFIGTFGLEVGEVSAPIALDNGILVLQLQEERTVKEVTLRDLEIYHEYFVATTAQQDLQRSVFESDLMVDNFQEAIGRFANAQSTPVQGPPTQAVF